jgi:hypothetical protein
MVPPGEKQRRHHERVGAEGQPGRRDVEHRLIFEDFEEWIAKRLQEQRLNEPLSGFSTSAVGHGNAFV